jgi:hypothetical protein
LIWLKINLKIEDLVRVIDDFKDAGT